MCIAGRDIAAAIAAPLCHIKVVSDIRNWLYVPTKRMLLHEPQKCITSKGELQILFDNCFQFILSGQENKTVLSNFKNVRKDLTAR